MNELLIKSAYEEIDKISKCTNFNTMDELHVISTLIKTVDELSNIDNEDVYFPDDLAKLISIYLDKLTVLTKTVVASPGNYCAVDKEEIGNIRKAFDDIVAYVRGDEENENGKLLLRQESLKMLSEQLNSLKETLKCSYDDTDFIQIQLTLLMIATKESDMLSNEVGMIPISPRLTSSSEKAGDCIKRIMEITSVLNSCEKDITMSEIRALVDETIENFNIMAEELGGRNE